LSEISQVVLGVTLTMQVLPPVGKWKNYNDLTLTVIYAVDGFSAGQRNLWAIESIGVTLTHNEQLVPRDRTRKANTIHPPARSSRVDWHRCTRIQTETASCWRKERHFP
jgi:hypothetical protein